MTTHEGRFRWRTRNTFPPVAKTTPLQHIPTGFTHALWAWLLPTHEPAHNPGQQQVAPGFQRSARRASPDRSGRVAATALLTRCKYWACSLLPTAWAKRVGCFPFDYVQLVAQLDVRQDDLSASLCVRHIRPPGTEISRGLACGRFGLSRAPAEPTAAGFARVLAPFSVPASIPAEPRCR